MTYAAYIHIYLVCNQYYCDSSLYNNLIGITFLEPWQVGLNYIVFCTLYKINSSTLYRKFVNLQLFVSELQACCSRVDGRVHRGHLPKESAPAAAGRRRCDGGDCHQKQTSVQAIQVVHRHRGPRYIQNIPAIRTRRFRQRNCKLVLFNPLWTKLFFS